jgi:ubiquinol-cytochrome c reductase cytochrome b subunit
VNPATYKKEYHAELERTGVPFWPDGAWRDFVFGTALIAGIALLAIVYGPPPIDRPPDPSVLQADPRPDWYLLWYFAVLAYIPPQIEGVVMILAPVLIGVILLLAPILGNQGERHWSRRPWAIGVVLMSVVMIGSLWIAGAKAPWSPNFDAEPLPAAVVGATEGPIADGARIFHQRACLNCHLIEGYGGRRGPDLTFVSDRLTENDIVLRIVNGRGNMPAYGSILVPADLDALLAFLETRRRRPAVAE